MRLIFEYSADPHHIGNQSVMCLSLVWKDSQAGHARAWSSLSPVLVVCTGIEAIKCINEAIDSGDEGETLVALQLPSAKLSNVDPLQALHYQVLLAKEKDKKAEVGVDDDDDNDVCVCVSVVMQ